MPGIEVDDSAWPLVIVHWPQRSVSDADVEAFLKRSAEHLAKRQRFATLHDGVNASGLDSRQRQRMAQYVTAHHDQLRDWHVAAAIVASSAIVRGVVTAVSWISPPPYAQRVFAARHEAEAWLRQVMRDGGHLRASGGPGL